jgi:hypothetical protein
MEIVTTILAIAALLFSLVSIAMQLVGRDVIQSLHVLQSQEIPDLKRQLARCLLFLVALTIPFAISCVPVWAWYVSVAGAEQTPDFPWWMRGWMVFCLVMVCLVGQFFRLCLRFALLLRDPNVVTFREFWLTMWAAMCGRDHVVLYTRRNGDGD